MAASTSHQNLLNWVDEWAQILEPDQIHWCDGSAEEYDRLCEQLGRSGHVPHAERGQATQQLPRAVRPG